MSEQNSAVYNTAQQEENRLKRAYLDGYYKGCQDTQKAAPRWVRCEEPPKKDGKYLVCWKDSGGFCWDSAWWNDAAWSLTHWVGIIPTHWMPIEPPKEVMRNGEV